MIVFHGFQESKWLDIGYNNRKTTIHSHTFITTVSASSLKPKYLSQNQCIKLRTLKLHLGQYVIIKTNTRSLKSIPFLLKAN